MPVSWGSWLGRNVTGSSSRQGASAQIVALVLTRVGNCQTCGCQLLDVWLLAKHD